MGIKKEKIWGREGRAGFGRENEEKVGGREVGKGWGLRRRRLWVKKEEKVGVKEGGNGWE